MEIALAYKDKTSRKHYILLKEGMHRVEDGKTITVSEYSAKQFEYEEDSEPSVADLMAEWGVPKSYFDGLASKLFSSTKTH